MDNCSSLPYANKSVTPEKDSLEDHRPITYSCFIHGEELQGGELYPLLNPSTGEIFAQATAADAVLVDSSLKSAQEAFKEWHLTPAHRRAEVLHRMASCIREEQELLTSIVSLEVGKPLRAAGDEVLSASALIDYFAEESLRLTGEIPLQAYPREHVLIVREPVGVIGAITPFNYPLSTMACKVGPALAVGCSVVAKPDEHTPASTLELARIALKAGLPPGVFNVVTGPGCGAGRRLVENPIPRLITFTGSTDVGKEIQAISSRTVRRVILELGGDCPAIICRDASWRDLLSQIVWQSFKNSGQYCYRINRIYVHEDIFEPFLDAFITAVSRLRVGPACDPEADLGPLNNRDILDKVDRQVEKSVRNGARIAFRGSIPDGSRGFYYPPTVVLSGSAPERPSPREEVFGPVVIISKFGDINTAIHEANATPFGLAAYLFTSSLGNALEWSRHLEVGSVWINRIHQAYMEAPFGGMKESGLGREKSRFGIEEFTELKTIYLCY